MSRTSIARRLDGYEMGKDYFHVFDGRGSCLVEEILQRELVRSVLCCESHSERTPVKPFKEAEDSKLLKKEKQAQKKKSGSLSGMLRELK